MKIVIIVDGGVVTAVFATEKADVEIVDYDDQRAEPEGVREFENLDNLIAVY